MCILITGGAGFIGSYIIKKLIEDDYENIIVYDQCPRIEKIKNLINKVNVIRGDITDFHTIFDIIKKFEVSSIIHLASLLIIESQERPLQAIKINCEGFINLLEAARILDIESIVWASSRDVYGPSSFYSKQPVNEEDPPKPVNVYGICKLFDEMIAEQYYKTYGIKAIGLRLEVTYGPGRFRGHSYYVVDLFEKPAKNLPITIECGDLRVNWLYVKDAAKAFVLAFKKASELRNLVYNIGGEEKTIKEVVEYIKTLMPNAKIYVKSGYGPFTQYPSIDISRAIKELGYTVEYPVEKGIRDYISYLLSHNY